MHKTRYSGNSDISDPLYVTFFRVTYKYVHRTAADESLISRSPELRAFLITVVLSIEVALRVVGLLIAHSIVDQIAHRAICNSYRHPFVHLRSLVWPLYMHWGSGIIWPQAKFGHTKGHR